MNTISKAALRKALAETKAKDTPEAWSEFGRLTIAFLEPPKAAPGYSRMSRAMLRKAEVVPIEVVFSDGWRHRGAYCRKPGGPIPHDKARRNAIRAYADWTGPDVPEVASISECSRVFERARGRKYIAPHLGKRLWLWREGRLVRGYLSHDPGMRQVRSFIRYLAERRMAEAA